MEPAAVAFDLDDTLAVTRRDRETLLTESMRAVGAPPRSRDAYLDAHAEHLTARSREPVFERLLDDVDTDADPTDLAAAYRSRINTALEPVPGVEEMLSTLRERYRLGLLTNGPVIAQRSKLRALGWADAFDVALVTGDLDAGKPDASAFTALVDALGTDPAETVFVGDDVTADIQGAADAGLVAVQVGYPDGPSPSSVATVHVDRADLAERLPAIIDAL
ncbi:HAD family hydrolase [Haloplanus halobius]|uniref:HAD family hydrolase n=1 Tax=Haloplanus halobius TaxID=2934938 RepID=UPI00200CC156|nr:HAD family hydrolase [Haloplanus sp. XH21]